MNIAQDHYTSLDSAIKTRQVISATAVVFNAEFPWVWFKGVNKTK